jgi:endonuclease G
MPTLNFRCVSLAAALAIPSYGFAFDFTHLATAAVLHQVSSVAERTLSHNPNAKPATEIELPKATGGFGGCRQYFAYGEAPVVPNSAVERVRALCFDGFAVLHSGRTKTPVFSAEVLTRQSLAAARHETRTDVFFEDARLPVVERASLEDYRGSGFDRGHTSPAGNRANERAMAQSFSLSNIVPQSPEHNRKPWADIEKATRAYVNRARGNVYVITGTYYEPRVCPIVLNAQAALGVTDPFGQIDALSGRAIINRAKAIPDYAAPRTYDLNTCSIGNGVGVPSALYKLVYDPATNRAWAHWLANTNDAKVGKPITYEELRHKTGIDYFPGVRPLS